MARLLRPLQIITQDVVVVGTAGGGTLYVDWVTPEAHIFEGGDVAQVTLQVKDSEGNVQTTVPEQITVPFTVTGTGGAPAIRGVDYEIRQSATGGVAQQLPFLRIDPGSAQDSFWLEPLDTDNRPDGADLTFDIEIVTSVDHTNGQTYTLGQGGEGTYALGTNDTLAGTVTTSPTVGDPIIGWVNGASQSIPEPVSGSTTVANRRISIAAPADHAGCTVDYTFSGTGASGTDYTTTSGSSGTLEWLAGDLTNKEVNLTIINNPATGADKTVILTLSSLSGCVIDNSGLVHTVTIEDADAPATIANLGFRHTAVTLPEPAGNGTIGTGFSVWVDIQSGALTDNQHADYTIPITASGTAVAGTDYSTTLSGGQIVMGNGKGAARFTVNPLGNNDNPTTDRVLTFTIGSPAGGQEWALGLTATRTITITFSNNDAGGGADVDDIPNSYLGVRLAPPREPYDATSPDVELYLDGAVRVSDGAEGGATDPIGQALIWAHAALDNSAVPLAGRTMGSEGTIAAGTLYTVRVWPGTQAAPTVVPTVGATSYSRGPSGWDGLNFGLTGQEADWTTVQTDVGVPVIRDVVFHASNVVGGGNETDDMPRWDDTHIYPETCLVDNIRLEGIWIRAGGTSGITQTYGFRLHTGSGTVGGSHGKIKLYDCRYRTGISGLADDAPIDGYYQSSAVAGFYRASWDIRNRVGHPYPFGEESHEHAGYFWSPQGSDTYSGMADAAGTPANTFIGLETCPNYPPGRTLWQFTNRKIQAPGPVGNGKLVAIRCKAQGCAGHPTNEQGGAGFTWWGHDGEIYIKDCEVNAGNQPRCGGGLSVSHEYNSTHSESSSSAGVRGGAYALESATETGRLYTTERLVIDGFTINSPAMNPNSGGRHPMQLIGVDDIEVVKFWMQNIGLSAQGEMVINKQNLSGNTGESTGPWAGLCFTNTFSITNLIDPTTGSAWAGTFSDYPGWNGSANLIKDGYHLNWYQDEDNYITMDSDAVDSYPAIVDEQSDNRLESSGDGLGTISHADWPAAASNTPIQPELTWAATNVYYGEPDGADVSEVLLVDMKAASMCVVRVRHRVTGTTGLTGPGVDDDSNHFNITPATGSASDITSPQDVVDDWAQVNYGEDNATGSDWSRQDRLELVLSLWDIPVALTTGTKTADLSLDDGTADPQWDYPKDDDGFANTLPDGDNKTATLNIVPVVDFCTLSISASPNQVSLAALPETVTITVARDQGQTADGLQLASAASATITAFGMTVDSTDAVALSWAAAEADGATEQFDVTIETADQVGSTLVVSINQAVHENLTGPAVNVIVDVIA